MALDCTFRIDTARSPCDTTTTPHLSPSPPFSPPVYHLSNCQPLSDIPSPLLSSTLSLLPFYLFYLSLSKRNKERKEERKKISRPRELRSSAKNCALPSLSPPLPLSATLRIRSSVPAWRSARFGNASSSGEMLGMARSPRNGLSCCSRD